MPDHPMKNPNAVIVFARTPEITRSVADEPFAALPWDDLDAIFHACLRDIVDRAAGIPAVDVIVYRNERYLPAAKMSPPGENIRMLDMPDGEYDRVVGQAGENAFLEYYHRVVVVLENNPLVGTGLIRRAFDLLGTEDDAVVVTPAADGRAAMLALKANHPSVFRPGAFPSAKGEGIMSRLCALDVHIYPTTPTAPIFAVDSPGTIDRLRRYVAGMDPSDPSFPKQTSGVFRSLEKKYRLKKAHA